MHRADDGAERLSKRKPVGRPIGKPLGKPVAPVGGAEHRAECESDGQPFGKAVRVAEWQPEFNPKR